MEEEIITPEEEVFDYHKLRYILNSAGYVCHASLGGLIVCDLGECTEYNGEIPSGYETIEEWYDTQIEEKKLNAWKIVDGNLMFDENKYNELQEQYKIEEENNSCASKGWVNNKLSLVSTSYDEKLAKETTGNAITEINDALNHHIVEMKIIPSELIEKNSILKIQSFNQNMLENKALSTTINNLEFTINEDKSITINGTATEDTELILGGSLDNTSELFFLKNNTNYMQCGLNNDVLINLYKFDGTDRELINSSSNGTINFSETKYITCTSLFIASGKTFDDKTIYPMLTIGNEEKEYVECQKSDIANIELNKYNFINDDYIIIKQENYEFHKNITLYPDENLYPSDDLYPMDEWEIIYGLTSILNTFEKHTIIQCNKNVYFDIKYIDNDSLVERISSLEVGQETITAEVKKKVSDEELGTKIVQNWESVRIAWNQISQYLQFEAIKNNASIVVYDDNQEMLMKIDKYGQWFYENGEQIGKIGTSYRGDDRGLSFFLKNAKYMSWNFYDEEDDTYTTVLRYEKGHGFEVWDGLYYANTDAKYIYGKYIMELVLATGGTGYFGIWGDDGNLYTLPFSTSDGRMKENIQESNVNALDILNKIKFRQFDWKNNKEHQKLGYIAQELEEIEEDLILKVPQKDNENNIVDYMYQINNNNMIAYLTKAVTELSQKIDEQQKQIDFLMKELKKTYVPEKTIKVDEVIKQYEDEIKKVVSHVKEKHKSYLENRNGKWVEFKNKKESDE